MLLNLVICLRICFVIQETLAVPQMMVVGDTTDMFMPLLDGFLCDPGKSSHVIDALMEQIPTQFNETRTTETVLLPAIKAGMEALKVHMILSYFIFFNYILERKIWV